WRADRREARRGRSGMDVALSQAGQPRRIRRLGAGRSRHAGTGRPEKPLNLTLFPTLLRSLPMDQLALTFTSPGIGYNQPPEAIDAEAFNARLLATHVDLVARFCGLQLACGRMPDPIASEEDAATATEFIAQCQLQVKQAGAAHKQEKSLFLSGGRAVDTFFKARSER